MKKLLTVILCVAYASVFSQTVLNKYPEGQDDYIGGNVQFYKDFHQVILDRNLKMCENPEEFYSLRLLIGEDAKIKYVKEENQGIIDTNKCAYELSREVVKHLKGWKSAVVEGKTVAAVGNYLIIPSQLFSDFKPGYDAIKGFEPASYKGGINEFRKKVYPNVDMRGFDYDADFQLRVTFVVQKDGSINDVKLEKSSGNKVFDSRIIKGISSIRNKWQPAKVYGFPIYSKMALPLSFKH